MREACSRPVAVHRAPGEPPLWVRCNSRIRHECRSCADLYAGDWARILRSGALPGPDVPASALDGQQFLFLTLTAPSFGKCHNTSGRRCSCGKVHRGEGLRGVPLDPSHYAYGHQVSWNYHAGALWDATRLALGRCCPSMTYAVVREWQARGALHFHALLRVPIGSTDVLKVQSAAQRVLVTRDAKRYGWGRQARCEELGSADATASSIGYVSKALGYSAKSWSENLRAARQLGPEYRDHLDRLDRAARRLKCKNCRKGHRCRDRLHDEFGSHGQLISISRRTATSPGWSFSGLTRRGLKAERVEWARLHGRKWNGIPRAVVDSVLGQNTTRVRPDLLSDDLDGASWLLGLWTGANR